jgi:hypothetical protein
MKLKRLAGDDTPPVEEHRRVCEERRKRRAEWESYVRAARKAMQRAAFKLRNGAQDSGRDYQT